jgi:DNA-binding response OmpR family regulator
MDFKQRESPLKGIPARPEKSSRILIAEDEASVRDFLVRGLTHAGYEVKGVADGSAALEALGDANFDLLITDIVMPQLDGISLALKVTKDYPQTRILMITGYAAERQRAYNLDVLIHDVLGKPFTLDQICSSVANSLAQPLPPRATA